MSKAPKKDLAEVQTKSEIIYLLSALFLTSAIILQRFTGVKAAEDPTFSPRGIRLFQSQDPVGASHDSLKVTFRAEISISSHTPHFAL